VKKLSKIKGKKATILLLILGILAACIIGMYIYIDNLAYKICRVEAGVNVAACDFMKDANPEAFFTEDSQSIDIAIPGEYQVEVKSGWFSHQATLYIKDTIAPAAMPVSVELKLGESCSPEAMVTDIVDATEVGVSFKEEPDFKASGKQQVVILLTDRGGNVTEIESSLFISPVVDLLTMEAGSLLPDVSAFLLGNEEAKYITDPESINMSALGSHALQLEVAGNVYETILQLEDTIAPTIQLKNVQGFSMCEAGPEAFVSVLEDVTRVTLSFLEEPDWSRIGEQEVVVVCVDEGGNETVKTTNLVLEEDTETPVITVLNNIEIYIGETISYRKGILVEDNNPVGLTLEIDSSQVNTGAEGDYPVIYTATDQSGNVTSIEVTVKVCTRTHTEEEIFAYADAVLEKIITPDMEPLEKVQAIYDYNMKHIGYISHSDKGSWLEAAYEGLVEGKGDCYVFACTAKALLTRAGIENIDIKKIPTKSMHFWNLVNIGDGWYHFDTTPRTDHPVIFMWTDEQLKEYSNNHYRSHNYDPTLYPEIN